MSAKHPKASVSGGEQRDLGEFDRKANDIVKTNHGKRKHTNGGKKQNNL